MDDKFWSIFAMPIGVAMCFGPAMIIWWLVDRKKQPQDEKCSDDKCGCKH